MDNLTERLDALRQKLQEADFLQRKGLSNEVGIWIFQYNAADEMAVRHFTRQIAADQELHCRIIERNLYEIFLAILDDKHISAAIPRQEEKLGSKRLLEQLQKIATGDKFIDKIDYAPHQPSDVLLLTGVGEVFPFMRVHNLLEKLQPRIGDIPIVVLYPGAYTGYDIKLFDLLPANPYYRAFNML